METETKAVGIETIIHTYMFYVNEPEGKAQYEALCARLKAQGLECFETWGGKDLHYCPELDGKTLTLETEHLFSNQWNTAPIEGVSELGLRVFDWAQDYQPYGNTKLKQGHYLEQTEEMKSVRSVRLVCGYCGAQYRVGKPEPSGEFCTRCLDSEYLKESEIYLLRLLPAESSFGGNRPPLTPEESAVLLPQYVHRQTVATDSRAVARKVKRRERVEEKFKKETEAASMEYRGMIWLLDRDVSAEPIFYSHTGVFCFGWSSPVSESVKSALLDVLCNFPFTYEIKCAFGEKIATRA